jgi:hypothetical protein
MRTDFPIRPRYKKTMLPPGRFSGLAKGRRTADVLTEGTKDSSSVYSSWFGKSVVLVVAFRQCQVPLPCSIIGESAAGVLVRLEAGWEMDVRKELILAIEEGAVAPDIWKN